MQMREPIFDVDSFARRHIGPNEEEVQAMLRDVGFDNVGGLIDATVPKDIRLKQQLDLPEAKSESGLMMIMLMAAGCGLWAMVLGARLCSLGADAIEREPGLPAARVVD